MIDEPTPALLAYESADREGLARLVNDVHAEFGFKFDPALDADLEDPARWYRHVWILKDSVEVVGSVAMADQGDGVAVVKRMYLRPHMRGRGWGRRLLDSVIAAAIDDGFWCLRLDTVRAQNAAWRLYERAGFRLTEVSGDALHYELDLRE